VVSIVCYRNRQLSFDVERRHYIRPADLDEGRSLLLVYIHISLHSHSTDAMRIGGFILESCMGAATSAGNIPFVLFGRLKAEYTLGVESMVISALRIATGHRDGFRRMGFVCLFP
jgi:hypothetical protein